MKADPAESLYVGDVYSVDYVGATGAGMQAVLFEVAGAYRGRDLPHYGSPRRRAARACRRFRSWPGLDSGESRCIYL